MPDTKGQGNDITKKATGFFNDALNRAKKFIDTTASKAEETGKKAIKFTEEVADSVSHSAESAVKKIKEISNIEEGAEAASTGKKPLALKLDKGVTLEKKLAELADEIDAYLEKNGECSIDKIVNVMKRRKNTQLMVFCAIGWLAHDKQITLGADNTTLASKKQKTR